MGKALIIAPSARGDLHDIVKQIAHDAPERAIKFGDDLRELIHSPIRIIYRIRSDEAVEIVRFWHAARGTPEP
jgi:plasmid stabilization system protein ParE